MLKDKSHKKKLFLFIPVALLFISGFYLCKSFIGANSSGILTISQSSSQKEALPSLYLAELLDLSYDKKSKRDDFDIAEGRRKLQASPLIEDATISFASDSHIKVKYSHVTPMALLADVSNMGLDKEGKMFPIRPYLSPKGLPKVYLGLKVLKSTRKLSEYEEFTRWEFAKSCLSAIEKANISGKVAFVDVSRIEEQSLGKNEIVLCVKYVKRKDFLRLSKRNYLNEVSNYIILCDKLKDETGLRVIDFRFDSCAFIEKF